MKNNPESKSNPIMVRLKNNTNVSDMAISNGFVQTKNTVEMPNFNAMMNFLFDFSFRLHEKGISLSILSEDKTINLIANMKKEK